MNGLRGLGRISFTLIAMLFAVVFSGCAKTPEPAAYTPPGSYKNIPGVTKEENAAIDVLRDQISGGRGYFVYSVLPSTEAFYDSNGQIRGFSALFCEWLSALFDIPFKTEFVAWDEYLATLANFKVDFSGSMTSTEERRKTYFMTSAIALQTIRCYQIEGCPALEKIAESRPLRLAFIESTTTIDEVCSTLENGAYEAILVRNIDEAYEILKNNKADAFFNANTVEAAFDIFGDVSAKDFLPLLYSPVSLTTQNPALKPIIRVTQKALDAGAARELNDLYNKGRREYMRQKLSLSLSPEEKEYIKNHPQIKFVAEYYNYPLSFYNTHENEWQGIVFDLLSEIGEMTGLSFKLENDRSTEWPALLEMVEEGKVSMSAEIIRSRGREGRFLWPQKPALTDKYTLISKSEYPNINVNEIMGVKVGLVSGSVYEELFRRWFPEHKNTAVYISSNMAFDALSRNEIDMVMSSEHRLRSITNYNELSGYKTNIIFDIAADSHFGFNKNEAVLCSIVDKAMRLINTDGISEQWMQKTYDYREKLTKAQLKWIIGAIALLFFSLFLIVIFAKNNRTKKQLEKMVEIRTAELVKEHDKTETLAHWYKSILDATPLPITVTDENMNCTFVNSAVESFLKIRREDMYGKPCSKWNANICNTAACGISCAKRGQKQTYFTHDNSSFKVDVEILKKKDGAAAGFIEIVQDITQIETMARKQAKAEAESNAKSAFIAKISHEIRTPMNGIIGFTELAQDGQLPGKTMEYLYKISDNANWLLQIINNVLDISKIESGKMNLDFVPFSLHEIMANCQALIMPKTVEKGLSLYCYAEPSIGKTIVGDPVRLRQALVNILSNAVKFTNIGTVKLAASLVSMSKKNATIHFEVKDSGIGMTPEQIERIFQPFIQADNSITRKYGGTGLGLTITKDIVEMMGGRLKVESTPGIGSKFCFDLTFDTIDEAPDGSTGKKVFEVVEKPSLRGDILICEDNVMNQQVICDHLEKIGIRPIIANNGKEGTALVASRVENNEKPFDLIFMDIHMPVMDGLEAASRISAYKTGTPIVAMTANIMSNDVELYKRSGIPDFLSKPFTSQELWKCLRKYFPQISNSAEGIAADEKT